MNHTLRARYFDGDFLDVQPIPVPARLFLVVVDLNAAKDTTEILTDLQDAYPFAKTPLDEALQRLFGQQNLDITERAIRAITAGDAKALGAVYNEAQVFFCIIIFIDCSFGCVLSCMRACCLRARALVCLPACV